MTTAVPTRRARDPRLDFFRGLAMFAIVIAHTPENPWIAWIPARFGFSDATEVFVFCSGMASAIAFGGIYASHGWWIGTVRALHRVWQVYWTHISVFCVTAALMAVLTALDPGDVGFDYVAGLSLQVFFDDPRAALPALLALAYVPNYFDILPMYLAILAMLPVAMALARIHLGLVALASLTLWLAAQFGQARLSAAPWSDAVWFFNPFGWQLLFFTGFALMAGWLPLPPVRRGLVALAAVVLAASLLLSWFRILDAYPGLRAAEISLRPIKDKSYFGVLRYAHFLALAYLAWIAVGPTGAALRAGRLRARLTPIVQTVGQQSLPVFVSGLVLSQLMGVALNLLGRGPGGAAFVNAAGIAALIATAYLVAWFKSEPWRRPAPDPAAAAPAATPAQAELTV